MRFTQALTLSVAITCSIMSGGRAQSVDKYELKDPMILIETAWTLLSQNDTAQAKMIADQIVSEAPLSPFAFHILGKIFHVDRDLDKAAESFLKAYSLYNARAKLHFDRYEARAASRDHLEADAELRTYTNFTNSALAVLDDLEKVDARLSTRTPGRLDDRGQVAASAPPRPNRRSQPANLVAR